MPSAVVIEDVTDETRQDESLADLEDKPGKEESEQASSRFCNRSLFSRQWHDDSRLH